MDYGTPRPSFTPKDGEVWSCAKCGNPIDSLPFDPRKNPDGTLAGSVYHKECLPPRRPRGDFGR